MKLEIDIHEMHVPFPDQPEDQTDEKITWWQDHGQHMSYFRVRLFDPFGDQMQDYYSFMFRRDGGSYPSRENALRHILECGCDNIGLRYLEKYPDAL